MPTLPLQDADEPEIPEAGGVYDRIRIDILDGRLAPGERLVVTALARRYGTSTNPIREALQQLRGEGFVLISHNRGARVRPIDEDFVRDVYEMAALIEPYLTRHFCESASNTQLAELRCLQAEIEAIGFDDAEAFTRLDTRFHRLMYDAHYNTHAVEIWARQRGILKAIGRNFPFSAARRVAILDEHRALIDALERCDGVAAATIIERHVRGSGHHLTSHLRASRAAERAGRSPS